MGVLEAAARIIELGGAARPGRVSRAAAMRAAFEAKTGAFSIDDPWFEERSRAFWCDAVTRGRFGREVERELGEDDRQWLGALERAHRGLFRRHGRQSTPLGREVLIDVWSGAEMVVTNLDDASRAELTAAGDQFLDGRVVGDPWVDGQARITLLPGSVFHPTQATEAILDVVEVARERGLQTDDALDALLRMERSLRALSRVKARYAYRSEALVALAAAPQGSTRRSTRGRSEGSV